MQVKELAVMMVKHFKVVEKRLDVTDAHNDDQFEAINRRLKKVEGVVSDTYENLDKYAKEADRYTEEMTALGSQVERHDHWIGELADHAKLKLRS